MDIKLLIAKLREFSTPELCDGSDVFRTMDYQIKPIVTQQKIVGTAFPIDVPAGEGGIVSRAIPMISQGDIIVIAGKGNCASSYWGDMRSCAAQIAGAEGVVIDGAFRDLEGCQAIGLPVYARGLTPGTALKTNQGSINVPVSCGGVVVRPGDIIVGDVNGICVIDPEEAPEIIRKAQRKKAAVEYTIDYMRRTGQIVTKVIYPEENEE